MFFYAPLTAISFICALLPMIFIQNPTAIVLFVWIIVFDAIFQWSYGGLTTPYQSWVSEQFIVHQRPKASAFQNLFGFIGAGVGIVFTLLVFPPLIETFQKTKTLDPIFVILIFTFGILVILLFYICALAFPVEKVEAAEMNFREDLKKVLKDKNFMRVCWLQGIAFLAIGMITPSLIGFATIVLKIEGIIYYCGSSLSWNYGLSFYVEKINR